MERIGVGLWGAVAIGIGGMVGGGIFAVLGVVATQAGGGAPLAFLAAGAIALLTASSYAKLSVAYPSRGGSVVFVDASSVSESQPAPSTTCCGSATWSRWRCTQWRSATTPPPSSPKRVRRLHSGSCTC